MNYRIDNLQYCNWSKEIFDINHEARLDAVHATICYHEDFDELQINIEKWKQYFNDYSSLISQGFQSSDIDKAKLENKTSIFLDYKTALLLKIISSMLKYLKNKVFFLCN